MSILFWVVFFVVVSPTVRLDGLLVGGLAREGADKLAMPAVIAVCVCVGWHSLNSLGCLPCALRRSWWLHGIPL